MRTDLAFDWHSSLHDSHKDMTKRRNAGYFVSSGINPITSVGSEVTILKGPK